MCLCSYQARHPSPCACCCGSNLQAQILQLIISHVIIDLQLKNGFTITIQMLGCTSPAWSSMSLCLNRVSAAFRPSLAPWLAAYFTSLRDSSKAGWDIQLPCLVIYCLICALSGCHLSICGGQHTRDQSRCDSTVFYTSACSVPSLLKCIHHGLPGSRRCSVP